MEKGLIKVFEKTNYCINPNTIEEIMPVIENSMKCQIEIHFISGKTRKIDFDNKESMELFIKKITE